MLLLYSGDNAAASLQPEGEREEAKRTPPLQRRGEMDSAPSLS